MATYAMDIEEKGSDATILVEAKTTESAKKKFNQLLTCIKKKDIVVSENSIERL